MTFDSTSGAVLHKNWTSSVGKCHDYGGSDNSEIPSPSLGSQMHTQRHTHTRTHARTHTHTHTQKQTNEQTERQTDRQTARRTDKQTDRQTDRQAGRQAGRQTFRQTHRPKHGTRFFLKTTVYAYWILSSCSSAAYYPNHFIPHSPDSSNHYCWYETTTMLTQFITS